MHLLSPRHLFSSTFPLLPPLSLPRAGGCSPCALRGKGSDRTGPVSLRRPEAGKGTKHILQILTQYLKQKLSPQLPKEVQMLENIHAGRERMGKSRGLLGSVEAAPLPFFAALVFAARLLLLEKRPENNKQVFAGCDL